MHAAAQLATGPSGQGAGNGYSGNRTSTLSRSDTAQTDETGFPDTDRDDRSGHDPDDAHADQAGYSDDQVRVALNNALNSPEFQSAPQLRAFLDFVVRASLGNQSEKIKGYTIAVEALGRPEDFNPVTDPIVRVEAARLRRRLETYYTGSGAGDPLRISIPKGSYTPRFLPVEPAAEPQTVTAATPQTQSGISLDDLLRTSKAAQASASLLKTRPAPDRSTEQPPSPDPASAATSEPVCASSPAGTAAETPILTKDVSESEKKKAPARSASADTFAPTPSAGVSERPREIQPLMEKSISLRSAILAGFACLLIGFIAGSL